MAQSNPAKVNQFTAPDPRQALFLEYYFKRGSDTWANAYQSAIKSGYEAEYAKVITAHMPKWLSDRVRDEELIAIADRNVKEFMEQRDDLKVANDMTKFVQKGLQKEKYAERIEQKVEATHTIDLGPDAGELAKQISALIKAKYD